MALALQPFVSGFITEGIFTANSTLPAKCGLKWKL